jgi:AcrR family transcriptional regulator
MTTSPSNRRGPYAKTAEKRAAIADAALSVVLQSGHRALTTAAVASHAEISERTMLYHFPTRDHLLVAALERSDEIVGTIPVNSEELRKEGLQAIPRLTLTGLGGDPAVMQLYNALRAESDNPDHPAHEYFRAHYARTIETFAQLVKKQQDEGIAHPGLDPTRVARQLHAVWGGLQSLRAVDTSFDMVADLEDAFRRLTGRGELEARMALGELAARL